jgi:DNA (cytosine-5)-methyltransferase 1
LQSFPDKYKTHKEITGSPNDFYSYKQFGNSINIYVVNKIIAELLERY